MDTKKKNWRQGRKAGSTVIISCICVMPERGDGAAVVSGWSEREERERYWEDESKRGGFSVD